MFYHLLSAFGQTLAFESQKYRRLRSQAERLEHMLKEFEVMNHVQVALYSRNSQWVLVRFFLHLWRWCCVSGRLGDDSTLTRRGDRVGECVNVALVSWRWCYATARCLGSCLILWFGVGGCVNVTLASWRWCYATARCRGSCFMQS